MPPIDTKTIAFPPNSGMIPEDIPARNESPTVQKFDLDAYRARKAAEEAEELARLEAMPAAHHKAEIIEAAHKAFLPPGFAMRPMANRRVALFASVVAAVHEWPN